jgi:hypothetical protein
MQHILKISVLTITVVFLFSPFFSSGYTEQENPLTKAIQLFDKRKFPEAEPAFKKLLDENPNDFMVNYFYGACRTENGHYSDQDLQYLMKASKEVYPIDIDYYFGVQYHAKSDWTKAFSYYNNYKKVATAEEQNRVNLSQRIEQCTNRINPFITEAEITKNDTVLTEVSYVDTLTNEGIIITVATIQGNKTSDNQAIAPAAIISETAIATDSINSTLNEDSLQIEDVSEEKPAELTITENTPLNIPVQEPVINFNINSEITYLFTSNFKTTEGSQSYNDGIGKQTELDKLNLRTEILREQYSKSKTRVEKDSLGQLIVQLENNGYSLNSQARKLFLQAKTSENNYWQNAPEDEKEKFITEINQAVEAIAIENSKEKVTPVTDILLSPLLVEDAPVQKPTQESKNTGIVYKIQLGAYSKGIPNSMKPVFKKITMIRKVETYTDEKGVVVYTTGNLTRFEDAQVMLTQVKQEGVKDAIIAAYFNGKRITLEQAKETEKQK